MDFKEIIAKEISKITNVNKNELIKYIEIPPNADLGDYAFPCFSLAKELKKSPMAIAEELKSKLSFDKEISKIEIAAGYLNFFVDKKIFIYNVLSKINEKQDKYGSSQIGKGKNIIVEYSSPNIAKPMHMGHLRNNTIGGALYKIYEFLGYSVTGVNFLGDWGINFAKIMAGYSMWKDEYTFTEDSLEPIVNIYVRFTELEEQDPKYTEDARKWHLKLEAGDEEAIKLWQWIKEISLKEAKKVYKLLNCKFDSYNGEAFYNDKMDAIVQELKDKKLLIESQGAQVVDLSEYNMPPCIILTSSGTTLYATRDLASLKYRKETYNFDKALYIVASEQQLHFKQLFKVFELMGYTDYAKNCEHIYYGLILDSQGKKMSTRKGTTWSLLDLLNEGIEKAKTIIEEKGTDIKDKDTLASQIGIGAIIFNNLQNSKIKDVVFDWDSVLNFQGETGPYVQYSYVRTRSILNKIDSIPDFEKIDCGLLIEKEAVEVIKLLGRFEDIVLNAADKNEPSLIARFLIDLSQVFSNFYNEHHVLTDNKEIQDARVILTLYTGMVLKIGMSLLGIEAPEKM